MSKDPDPEIQVVQVLTTTDSLDVANQIGNELIENALAACVQIEGPVTSIYEWNQQIENSKEFRLSIKTIQSKLKSAIAAIESIHNYDTPQIIALPVIGGSKSYLKWVREQTS